MSGISEQWERWYSSAECAEQYGESAAMIGRRMARQLADHEAQVDREAERLQFEKEKWGGESEALARRVAKMRELGVMHWSDGTNTITLSSMLEEGHVHVESGLSGVTVRRS